MKARDKEFTIGKLAEQANVNVETVRFYERKGLIKQPNNATGFRKYPEEDVFRIRFIKKTQELGFTLKEAKELLELKVSKTAKCSTVKEKTELKISEVELKIKDLRRIRKTLKNLSEACGRKNLSTTECPILESFEKGIR